MYTHGSVAFYWFQPFQACCILEKTTHLVHSNNNIVLLFAKLSQIKSCFELFLVFYKPWSRAVLLDALKICLIEKKGHQYRYKCSIFFDFIYKNSIEKPWELQKMIKKIHLLNKDQEDKKHCKKLTLDTGKMSLKVQ